jgi:hypothetical protein
VPRPGIFEAHPSLALHGGKRGGHGGGGYGGKGQRFNLGDEGHRGLLAMAADGLHLPERGGILGAVAPSAVAVKSLLLLGLAILMGKPSVES